MAKNKSKLLITSIITLLLIGGIIIGFTGLETFRGLNLIILILIIAFAIIAFTKAFKKDREIKKGFPAEDEMSNLIKYKAGYHSFMASMYMWLFIFLLKDKFPDTETMLGGGILLSGLISFIITFFVKRNFNENPN